MCVVAKYESGNHLSHKPSTWQVVVSRERKEVTSASTVAIFGSTFHRAEYKSLPSLQPFALGCLFLSTAP